MIVEEQFGGVSTVGDTSILKETAGDMWRTNTMKLPPGSVKFATKF